MNIENISAGQIFKNYKELCLELEEEVKAGDSKKAHLAELARYCNFEKVGHRIKIKEIYDIPIEKVENRGRSESRNIYGKLIQLLITDLLAKYKGHLSISRSMLLRSISMVNSNYSICGENISKLSRYIDAEEAVVYDFYNTSNSNFKNAIETALNNLMDKRIIIYDRVTKVREQGSVLTRLATQSEKTLIAATEKKLLEELGYEKMSQVRCSKHWKTFKIRARQYLHQESNLDYYFMAYDITINDEYIKEERNNTLNLLLEQAQRTEYRDELNETVYLQLIDNAEKRKVKASTIDTKMSKTRRNFTYIEHIKKLITLLIDSSTGDMTGEIFKVNPYELSIEQLEQLDEMERLFG